MREPRETLARLDRWVEHGLISAEQAEGIRKFEGTGPARDRLPPVAEAVAYLGILLAVAAALALWIRLADDGSGDVPRLAVSVGVTVVLLAAGWPVGARPDPAMRRIGAALWLLGTIGAGFATLDGYVAATDGSPPDVTTFAVGTTALLVGGGAYLLRREAATQVGAFLGAAVAIVGLPVWLLSEDAAARTLPVLLLVLGATWLLADALGWLPPSGVGRVLGAIAALLAPLFGVEEAPGAWLLLGSAVSAGLLVAGVRLPGTAVTVLAGLGLFGYLTGTILHFFGETIGAPLALLLGAAVLLAVALLYGRRGRRSGAHPDGPGIPPAGPPPATGDAAQSG